jgi:alanyl-tRNA synthetase
MSPDEIAAVEGLANRLVLRNEPVTTRLMAVDDAIASGARALFGEKYGDEVRVVAMGTSPEDDPDTDESSAQLGLGRKPFSIELCGGTHARRTGDIGLIAIQSESGVASGVRRLEAVTGETARMFLVGESRALREMAGLAQGAPRRGPEQARRPDRRTAPVRARTRRPPARGRPRRRGRDWRSRARARSAAWPCSPGPSWASSCAT